MASNTLKLIAMLCITISVLLSLYPHSTFSFEMEDFDDEEEYVPDEPVIIPNLRSRRHTVVMCSVIGTTAVNAATGASSGNVAAVGFVRMLFTMLTIVASVTSSVHREFSVTLGIVVMLRFKYL
ncbi:hypothetical protein Gotur_029210 [Gossypium turneri]